MSKVAAEPPGQLFDGLLDVAPFVNVSLMSGRLHQHVRLVARVLAVNGGTAEVEAADGGRVTVRVNSGSPLEPNVVYQFLGKANSATDFSESKTVAWGAIDFPTFNKMLELQSQYPDLFNDRY
jgi:hypothetical protein